jgi:hypothetical protein
VADHHIISRQKLRNNEEGWRLVDVVYRPLFVVPLCQGHHRNSHNRRTIRYLLSQQTEKGFSEEYVRNALNEVASTFVDGGHEFTWDALVG